MRQKEKNLLKLNICNIIIYSIFFIVSVIFIALGFIKKQCFSTWANVFLSVGASGIGAVLLAFFIEFSNNKQIEKNRLENRDELLNSVRPNLYWLINRLFWAFNRIEIEVLNKRENDKTYKITLGSFVNRLEAFADCLEDRTNNIDLNNTNKIICDLLNCSRYKIEAFIKDLFFIVDKYRFIEKSELFTKEEIEALNNIIIQLGDFNNTYIDWVVNLHCIKSAFEELFKIKDFLALKDIMLYYKDKTISFMCLHNDDISEEDKNNAEELK